MATKLSDRQLDSTNLLLIEELQRDARQSHAALGRLVGLSPPAVAERLARLEESGVIRGYHAEIDPRALGLTLSVVLRIRSRETAEAGELFDEFVRIFGNADRKSLRAWMS